MAIWQVGQVISVSVQVKDSTGTLANTGVAPTASIIQPDGTTAAATVTNPSTGNYTATSDAGTAQGGLHRFLWVASGANSAALNGRSLDEVNVWPVDPRFLISLPVARDALNLAASNTVHDDELMLYIAAATEVIEDITGPLIAASITRLFDGGETAVLLPQQLASVTSVTESGVTLTAGTDYVADLPSGILYRTEINGRPRLWGTSWGAYQQRQIVSVVYTVGSGVIPQAVARATTEEVRFLYQISQQGGRPAWGQDQSEMAWTPSGFAVPRMVSELCQPTANKQRFQGVL